MEERPPDIEGTSSNKVNKQTMTADKGWSSSLGLGDIVTTPYRINLRCYETFHKTALDRSSSGSGLGPVAGPCKWGDETLLFTKCGEFLQCGC